MKEKQKKFCEKCGLKLVKVQGSQLEEMSEWYTIGFNPYTGKQKSLKMCPNYKIELYVQAHSVTIE